MNKKKILIAILLVVIGVIGRLVRINFFPELYNVEPITVIALLAGAFLGLGYAAAVPLAIIAITDMYLGNTSVLFFTWSAWAVIGLGGLIVRKSKKDSFKFGLKMTGLGILASVFFYIWTNFGVWISWNMYPHTLEGLIQCYVLAIPFFRNNLVGNLIIIPSVIFTLVLALKYAKAYKLGALKQDIKITK